MYLKIFYYYYVLLDIRTPSVEIFYTQICDVILHEVM